jgi:hypothetical protein
MPSELKVTVEFDGKIGELTGRVADEVLLADGDEALAICALQCFWQTLYRVGLEPPKRFRPGEDPAPW